MFKRIQFLLVIGSFILSIAAYGSAFEIQEYSGLKKYLNPQQHEIFEEVIGGNLNLIKNNEDILEILKKDAKENSEAIVNIQKEIENLKSENEVEIIKLKKDFIRNPQRYNPETIHLYPEESKN